MAFEGYTQETLDFLWGIRFHTERSWFLAHKQDYEAHLLAPTRALGEQVYEALHAAFPKEPFLLKLSRIYRDARRLHGNGPYKDHLWFCVRAGGEDWTGRPTFYFEIGPDYYSYGMGFWAPKAALMEAATKAAPFKPSPSWVTDAAALAILAARSGFPGFTSPQVSEKIWPPICSAMVEPFWRMLPLSGAGIPQRRFR